MHMYMYSAEKEAWHILRVCAQACLTLCDPMDCRLLSMGFFRQEY